MIEDEERCWCYVCNRAAEVLLWPERGGHEVNCGHCGPYRIGRLAELTIRHQWASGQVDPLLWYLPAAIRQSAEPPTITLDGWREMARPHAERSHEEKMHKLLALLKERSSFRGEAVAFEHKDQSLVGIGRDHEATFVLRELMEAGLITGKYPLFRVTSKGWNLSGDGRQASDRIFLSHAASDATHAAVLADEIRKRVTKAEVFVASQPGQNQTEDKWLEAVETRLEGFDAYIILLSNESIEERWVWFETGAIWFDDRKRILLVAAAGLDHEKIPHPLSARRALDLQNQAHVRQFFRDLNVDITDTEAESIASRLNAAANS